MIEITLPYPPSVNKLWRNVNGRTLKSKEYRQWESAAIKLCSLACRGRARITGRYILTILAERPDNRRRDLGNIEKGISDSLQKAGVIRDDCEAEEIHMYWSGHGDNVIVKVEGV